MGALLPDIFQTPLIALLSPGDATAHRAPAINAAGDGWEWRNLADASLLTTGTIPDARISNAIARTSALSGYLPLTGGTLTGNLNIGALGTLTAAGNIFTQGLAADVSVSAGYQSGPDSYASLIGPTSGYLRSWNGSSFTSRFGWDTTGIRFFGSSGVAQQAQTVDLKDALVNYGLIGSGAGATPLDLDGGTITANGSGLTSLNASNVSSGTLSDDRLSANIARLNVAQTWTQAQTWNAPAGQSLVATFRSGIGATSGQTMIDILDTVGVSRIRAYNNGVFEAVTFGGGGVSIYQPGQNTALRFYNLGAIGWSSAGVSGTLDVGLARESANLLKVTDGSTGYGSLRADRIGLNRAPGTGGIRLAIEGTMAVYSGANGTFYNFNGFDSYPSASAFFRVNGAGQGLYFTTEDPQGIYFRADGTTNRVQFSSTVATFAIPIAFTVLAAAPASPSNGWVYYDSTTNKLRVRAGGSWQDLH